MSRPSAERATGGPRSTGPSVATNPDDAGRDVRLDGYTVALPRGYRVGRSPGRGTNCTRQLHLSPEEGRRLVSPAGGCPLRIIAVSRALPAGAVRETVPGVSYDGKPAPQSVVWYTAKGTAGQISLFPAKLPDGHLVYVSLAAPTRLYYQQVVALADGLRVVPVDHHRCSGPCG